MEEMHDEIADDADQEADELLKWARDLPEVSDEFKASGSSFFKKGIV